MSLLHQYSFNSKGKITKKLTADSRDIVPTDPDKELITDVDVDWQTHYIKNRQIFAIPQSEMPYFDFDYTSETLVFNLTKAREFWWDTIKRARNRMEFGTLTFQGKVYDIDEVSQRRIQGAVQLASLNPSLVLDWTTADNSSVSLTATDLIDLGMALAQRVDAAHYQARLLRNQINEATTETELQAITWTEL